MEITNEVTLWMKGIEMDEFIDSFVSHGCNSLLIVSNLNKDDIRRMIPNIKAGPLALLCLKIKELKRSAFGASTKKRGSSSNDHTPNKYLKTTRVDGIRMTTDEFPRRVSVHDVLRRAFPELKSIDTKWLRLLRTNEELKNLVRDNIAFDSHPNNKAVVTNAEGIITILKSCQTDKRVQEYLQSTELQNLLKAMGANNQLRTLPHNVHSYIPKAPSELDVSEWTTKSIEQWIKSEIKLDDPFLFGIIDEEGETIGKRYLCLLVKRASKPTRQKEVWIRSGLVHRLDSAKEMIEEFQLHRKYKERDLIKKREEISRSFDCLIETAYINIPEENRLSDDSVKAIYCLISRYLLDEQQSNLNDRVIRYARDGKVELLKRALREGGDVDTTEFLGYTPLMRAADNGHSECVKILLEKGADIEKCDQFGSTALMHAAERGQMTCLRDLLIFGANTEVKTRGGQTALILAVEDHNYEIAQLLLDYGAEPNVEDEHHGTTLMTAAYNGFYDLLVLLTERGANINAEKRFVGYTAVALAALEGHMDCVEYLINQGASNIIKVEDLSDYNKLTQHQGCTELLNIIKSF